MRSLLILALTSVGVASAQFSGLSSSADGSSVYFSSPLRLRGTTQSFNSKIFVLDAAGPRLSQARDPGPQVLHTATEFYNLVEPQVADDGSVLAFTGTRPCYFGSGCVTAQTAQGTIVDNSGHEILRALGYVNISPSGQWAVFSGRNTFGSSLSPTELIDLSTNTQIDVPYHFFGPTLRRVADDGTVAFFNQGTIVLWRSDSQQTITDTSIPFQTPYPEPALMISNDGQRVIYQNGNALVLYDRTQAAGINLASDVTVSATISDDTRTIAWISGPDSQISVASTEGTNIPAIAEGAAEIVLSGDGSRLFAVTKTGRLLEIELPLGTTAELIPRTPSITTSTNVSPAMSISGGVAAGSITAVTGTGFSDLTLSATPPISSGLGDVRILISGTDVPVEAISPSLVWFQVPWELVPQDYTLEFLSGSSPFETGPGTITIESTAPRFFGTAYGDGSLIVTAVHGDWSGVVGSPNFAYSGELIYLYMTGLGPVTPLVPTGAATPDTPLHNVNGSLRCQFEDGLTHDANIYFAGLAPGMLGIYQVALQVPYGLRAIGGVFGISCSFGLNQPAADGLIYVSPNN